VKAEKNPPGDIPDDQVFITYASPLGFALKVPEGWARIDRADGVIFADKYGKIEVALTTGDLPTPKTAADAVKTSLHAVDVKKAETTDRPAGRAIYVAFGLQFRAQRRHQQADTPGTFGRRERDRGDLSALHEQVAIVFSGRRVILRPATSTRPPSGSSSPAMQASSVDLPLPDGPTRATTSAGPTVRLAPRSALTSVSPT
jgi:hypothetical protein